MISWPSQPELRDLKKLSRAISLVENNADGSLKWLSTLSLNESTPIIGITGPPGVGKSTLINSFLNSLQNKKVAVIAVDPSSTFTHGSLLGDRIRMSSHFTNPNVFIRSLSTRGILGGISGKTFEICDILKAAEFDLIIIETVGVGQTEVEITSLADTTILVLNPESGDEIQALKSGIMESADIIVVNKSDRPGADKFLAVLKSHILQFARFNKNIPVVSSIATENAGMEELNYAIKSHLKNTNQDERKALLYAERAYNIIRDQRMKDVNKTQLYDFALSHIKKSNFNLYDLIDRYTRSLN